MYFHGDVALEACREPVFLRGEFSKALSGKVGCFLEFVNCSAFVFILQGFVLSLLVFCVQIEVLLHMLDNNLLECPPH